MAAVNDLVVASASVKGGKLFIRNRRGFDQQIAQMKDGWEVELTIQRRRATRSLQQNAYYWGVVIEAIADHTGYPPDDVHELMKQMFIPKRLAVQDGNGEIVGDYVLGGSTRTMNKLAFGDFMESIRRWAATELDVVIPDPNEL